MPVRYILSSVWVRLSIFSQLSIIQYVELCLFSSPFPLWSLIEYIYIHIYTLSYYHNQIGSMNYCPLFRVRSWNNGVRCMSFYILICRSTEWPVNTQICRCSNPTQTFRPKLCQAHKPPTPSCTIWASATCWAWQLTRIIKNMYLVHRN